MSEGGDACTCDGAGFVFMAGVCTPCPAGSYSGINADVCLPCPSGTIAPRNGSSTCDVCPPATAPNANRSQCLAICPQVRGPISVYPQLPISPPITSYGPHWQVGTYYADARCQQCTPQCAAGTFQVRKS